MPPSGMTCHDRAACHSSYPAASGVLRGSGVCEGKTSGFGASMASGGREPHRYRTLERRAASVTGLRLAGREQRGGADRSPAGLTRWGSARRCIESQSRETGRCRARTCDLTGVIRALWPTELNALSVAHCITRRQPDKSAAGTEKTRSRVGCRFANLSTSSAQSRVVRFPFGA